MAQSSLKVDNAPNALKQWAAAHNALVDLIKTTQGAGGIKVIASDGRIIIDGSGVSTTAGVGGAVTTASALYYNDGIVAITIGAIGIKLTNIASGDYTQIFPSGNFEMFDASSGNYLNIDPSDMFYGNYSMQEYSVCSNGSPAYARFLSSTTY